MRKGRDAQMNLKYNDSKNGKPQRRQREEIIATHLRKKDGSCRRIPFELKTCIPRKRIALQTREKMKKKRVKS